MAVQMVLLLTFMLLVMGVMEVMRLASMFLLRSEKRVSVHSFPSGQRFLSFKVGLNFPHRPHQDPKRL